MKMGWLQLLLGLLCSWSTLLIVESVPTGDLPGQDQQSGLQGGEQGEPRPWVVGSVPVEPQHWQPENPSGESQPRPPIEPQPWPPGNSPIRPGPWPPGKPTIRPGPWPPGNQYGVLNDHTLQDVLHSDLTLDADFQTIVSVMYGGLFTRYPGFPWFWNEDTQSEGPSSVKNDGDNCCRASVVWSVPNDVVQMPGSLGYQGYRKAVNCINRGCGGHCVFGETSMSFLVMTRDYHGTSLRMEPRSVPTYCKCVP